MCQGDMYSLFDLFSNKFCIINSETHNYFKEEAFTAFHNQSRFYKSPVVGYFYSTEFEIWPVVQFRVHDFLCNVSNFF